jgi:uncharacterized protein (UPF0335 family)
VQASETGILPYLIKTELGAPTVARKPKASVAGIGDNSLDGEKLEEFVDRLDKLQEDADEVADDIESVYKEVKASGFDTKTLRKVMKLRRMEKELREAEAEMLIAYCKALGL